MNLTDEELQKWIEDGTSAGPTATGGYLRDNLNTALLELTRRSTLRAEKSAQATTEHVAATRENTREVAEHTAQVRILSARMHELAERFERASNRSGRIMLGLTIASILVSVTALVVAFLSWREPVSANPTR